MKTTITTKHIVARLANAVVSSHYDPDCDKAMRFATFAKIAEEMGAEYKDIREACLSMIERLTCDDDETCTHASLALGTLTLCGAWDTAMPAAVIDLTDRDIETALADGHGMALELLAQGVHYLGN